MAGAKAFGVQSPTSGEDAVSWQTWTDGAGNVPTITGDADWGKLKLDLSGEEGRSAVYDHGSAVARTYTLSRNVYGTGDSQPVLLIRGSETSFTQDSATPVWEAYTTSISRTWRYVQVASVTPLEAVILNIFDGNIVSYLPIKDTTGTTITDVSGNGYNGATGGSTGPTLNVAGIGDGGPAASFPGTNAHINWYSAGLAGAFDGAEGTLIAWAKVSSSGVWSDGTGRYIARLSADSSNDIRFLRSSSNANMVLIQMIAGGTSRPMYVASNASTGWLMYGITWSVAGGYTYAWVNGTRYGGNLGAPGTWAGSLSSTLCTLGASSTSSGDGWSGSIAHALLLDRPATEAEMMAVYRAVLSPVTLTVIGDSISTNSTNILKYTSIVRDGYNSGRVCVPHHTQIGAPILHADGYLDLDDFTLAAANDSADIIIIEMGTNDTTTTGLQAEVEENISELKTSNPNATIYFMNILPRWTDSGGGTPVDKSAFRSAIAAACTAQSITCWDTYTDPWITAADTADGLHPNAAGHAKIAAEVLERI